MLNRLCLASSRAAALPAFRSRASPVTLAPFTVRMVHVEARLEKLGKRVSAVGRLAGFILCFLNLF